MSNLKDMQEARNVRDEREVRKLLESMISHYGPRWYLQILVEFCEGVAENASTAEIRQRAGDTGKIITALSGVLFRHKK